MTASVPPYLNLTRNRQPESLHRLTLNLELFWMHINLHREGNRFESGRPERENSFAHPVFLNAFSIPVLCLELQR